MRRWTERLGEVLAAEPSLPLVLGLFAGTRLALLAMGAIALRRLPFGLPPHPWPSGAPPLLSLFARWDSQWYLRIARQGYWYEPRFMSPEAFFPLYPLLMAACHRLFGGSVFAWGLFWSNAPFLASLVLLHRLVRRRYGKALADRTVTYLVLFPTGFFFSAVYTESLFLFLAVLTLSLAEEGRMIGAAVTGALAAATRIVGAALFLPVALVAWEAGGQGGRRALWALFIPVGTLAYLAYTGLLTGNPLVFLRLEHHFWGHTFAPPWVGIDVALSRVLHPLRAAAVPDGGIASPWTWNNAQVYSAIDLVATLAFLLLAAFSFRIRLPVAWQAYLWLGLLMPLISPLVHGITPLQSITRYEAVLFPAFVALAWLGEAAWFDRLVTGFFPLMQGMFFILFITWNWIA